MGAWLCVYRLTPSERWRYEGFQALDQVYSDRGDLQYMLGGVIGCKGKRPPQQGVSDSFQKMRSDSERGKKEKSDFWKGKSERRDGQKEHLRMLCG